MHDAFRQKATVVINPAGFSFSSVPLLDALKMLVTPIVEVHITNIHARDAVHQQLPHLVGVARRDRRRRRVRVRAGDPRRRPVDGRIGSLTRDRLESAGGDRVGGLDTEHEGLRQRGSGHVRRAMEPPDDLAGGVQAVDARPVDAHHRGVGQRRCRPPYVEVIAVTAGYA